MTAAPVAHKCWRCLKVLFEVAECEGRVRIVKKCERCNAMNVVELTDS